MGGKIKCFYCDGKGHIKKKYCITWKNKLKEDKNKKKTYQNIVASASNEKIVVVVLTGED